MTKRGKRAYQITQKASKAGFDWPEISGWIEKLDEECREIKGAVLSGRKDFEMDKLWEKAKRGPFR